MSPRPLCILTTLQQAEEDDPMGDADDEAADDEEPEPATRAAFNALRASYKNTAGFVLDLFQDKKYLQDKLKLIVYDLEDLHAEYSHGLKMHRAGQESMMRFVAERSAGSTWMTTVNKMLTRLVSGSFTEIVDLHPGPSLHAQELSSDDLRLVRDHVLVKHHADFLLDLCSNRIWSQSFFGLCWPYMLSQAYLEDEQGRRRARALWKLTTETLLSLEDFCAANPLATDAHVLLKDFGTNEWQLSRECMVLMHRHDYSPDHPEIKELAWQAFAGPFSTKDLLESAFNHIKDSGERQSRSNRMSPYTRWSYLAVNPYARDSGVKQSQPDKHDFAQLSTRPTLVARTFACKPFTASATKLPPDAPSRQAIEQQWRPAGYLANRQSAAAVAFAIHARANFGQAQHAWAGRT